MNESKIQRMIREARERDADHAAWNTTRIHKVREYERTSPQGTEHKVRAHRRDRGVWPGLADLRAS